MTAFTFVPGDTTQWVAVLIDAAAKGLVVLLLAAGATLLLRRSSAAVRHMTWTLSIAALILVPFLSLALPQLQVPLLPDWAGTGGLTRMEQTAAQSLAMVEPRVDTGGPRAESIMPAGDWPLPAGAQRPVHPADAAPETPAAPVPAAAAPQTPPVHWPAWVLLAWFAGATALLLPLLAGTVIVWRQARRAERINSGSWGHLLDELRPRLGVRGRVVLLRSNWPNIPLTCGIFRPAIILPAEADNWPADRRRVVLLHELAHIRRRDCLTQLLARLARVIYWFNPLVWLAGRMLRIEREQACDDLVLASGHKASDYAGHLLEIVRSLHSVRCPSLAAVAMARKSQFEGRLLAILDPRRNRRAMTRLGVLAAAILVAAVAVPLAVLKATGPEKPVAAKADEPARKFPAFVVFVNNCRYGPTNGGSSIPPEGGVTQETGKSTDGHPGAVSEVEWKYLRTTDAGDEYEVTRRFPVDTATPNTEKKTVTYSGKPLTVFEDDVQRVLFLSREDFKSLQEGKATATATQPAEMDQVHLPGGMSVKILGVRPPHQDDSMPWYAPDGSGEVKMPYAHAILREGLPVERYTVAFQITGVPPDAQNTDMDRPTFLRATGEGTTYPWFEGKGKARTMYVLMSGLSREALASRFLFVAQPQWYDVGQLHVAKSDEVVTVNQFAGMPPAEFRLLDITSKDGKAVVTFEERGGAALTRDGRAVPNYDIRMVAIDEKGKEHGHTQGPAYSAIGGAREGSFTFDLPAKEIVSLRLKVRPYSWVEFQNISVGPNEKTELKAILRRPAGRFDPTGKSASPAPESERSVKMVTVRCDVPQPEARLPNGGKLRLLAITGAGKWWSPDGTPLEPQPDWKRFESKADDLVAAVLELVYPGAVPPSSKIGPVSELWAIPAYTRAIIKKSAPGREPELVVGMGAGPWKTVGQLAGPGRIEHESLVCEIAKVEPLFRRPSATANGTAKVDFWMTVVPEVNAALVAVGRSGQEQTVGYTYGVVDYTVARGTRWNLPSFTQMDAVDIDHFELRTQPRSWARFVGFAASPRAAPVTQPGATKDRQTARELSIMVTGKIKLIGADRTQWQIVAPVMEDEITQVAVGQDVVFTLDAFRGRAFKGEVTEVGDKPNAADNVVTYPVVIRIVNPDPQFKPGMTANVEILQKEQRPDLTASTMPATQPAAPDEKTKPFTYKLHHKPDEVAATINKIFGNGAATRPAPEATSTQPAGGKLEFRIAPSPSALSKEQRTWYVNVLKEGKVGFWWKGGQITITGPMPDHAWLAFADDMANAGNLVTGEYNGQKYVLVSDKPGQTMVLGEGKDAWGLAKVYSTKDPLNQPAVGFELDDRGAELFSAFTKANIGNVVAIVVDGKVISVPVIMAAIGKQGTIPGRFSEQEVKDLVQSLKAGMPAGGPAATQPGGKDQVFLPAGSLDVRRERLLWKEGVTPAVQVDIRNSGMERFFITRTPDGYEVEIDGRWYHWAPDRSEAPKYTCLVKNAGAGDVRLLLDRSWQSKADGTPLHFRTGMHKLRVGAIRRRTPDASAESHTIVSGASQVIIESPAVDDPNDPEGFRRELLLAKQAGAAIEKVRHLHKARQYRPQPDDIELEYGVATYLDNFAGGRGREEREAMWGEARDLLQHIIDTYDHMRYYTTSGPDTPRAPEVLLPGSAVMLGYRRGDPNLCYQAMVWLKQTNDRRVKDWLEAPEPIFDPNNPFTDGVVDRSKWQSRVANWRKRKEDAAAGNALNGVESQLAAEAVRGYVQGFGPHEGADALRRIIRDFPRTAMARLAAQQLELATGQTPAMKATGQPSQVDWGAAENGLRCRWVQPKGSFASGTAPEVSAEVDNHGPTPVIWQCIMHNIWQLRIAGVWQEDWEQPSFDIEKIGGVRHATAREVRQAFGDRTTSAPDEQACDGYYRVEAGGRLKVTTTLPWKLTSPGAYRLECRFIRSFMSRGGQLMFISCPPLVLRVTNAESPTQPAHSASSRPAPDVPQDVHSANANATLTWGKGPVRIQDGNSVIEGKRITIEDGHMQVEGNAILQANNGADVKADRINIRPNAAVTAPATQPAPSPAAGTDVEAKARFDSLEVAVGRGIWWWNRKLTISGDGTYTFELQTLEKVPGGDRIQQSRTPYVATYRISAGDMRELNQLLKATNWLGEKVPEGPGPCDAPEYAMTLRRGGTRTVRRVFQGDAWAAYKSVLRFIMRIERQEELLYAVTNIGKPSPTAANDLGNEIEAVTSGAANRIVPYAPVLDYHRLVPAYCEYLANPKASASLAITAAKLAGMVKLETRRKDLEALANGRAASDPAYKVPVEVRGAAVAALARMGAASSLDALESAARTEKYCLAGDVAEALLTAPPDKAIPILTELASRAQNAAWALIRLGKRAEPAIVELLGKGGGDFAGEDHGGGRAAYLLVRAYHDHWKELPAAPGGRVMTAVREIIEIGEDASMAVEYGRKLLSLAQKPYEPPTARMALEKYFALMTRPVLSDHEKHLAAGQFVPNKPPDGFLDNVRKGKLKVGDIYTLKQDGWAHMVAADGKTHYTMLLFDTRRTWWIVAAFKLSAEGVRADKDRFLARHPGAKLEQAKTTAPVGRNGPNAPARFVLVSNTGDLPCADSF